MRPYTDPTTGEWVGEYETRVVDQITRQTEWFATESEARRFAQTGKQNDASPPVPTIMPTGGTPMIDSPATFTKPEDLRPFRVDPEGFWLVERMAGGDGYDVMDVAQGHRWVPVSGWGRDGWDFLEWPYYVGYVRNTPEGYKFATNCEGDIDVWRFPTRELRERALDLWAFLNWERKGESWAKGFTAEAIPDHLRGPYSPDRHAEPTSSGPPFYAVKGEGR